MSCTDSRGDSWLQRFKLFPRIDLFKLGPYKPSEWQEVSDFFYRNDTGEEGVERLKSKMHDE